LIFPYSLRVLFLSVRDCKKDKGRGPILLFLFYLSFLFSLSSFILSPDSRNERKREEERIEREGQIGTGLG